MFKHREKKENAGNQHFSPFPTVSSNFPSIIFSLSVTVILGMQMLSMGLRLFLALKSGCI